MLFILGAPRSGTSWLAKIFDSHPNVALRHEPDTIIRNREIPAYCERDSVQSFLPEAKIYLNELMRVRTSKVVGSIPFFPKSYESLPVRILRKSLAYGAKAGERISVLAPYLKSMPIPDLFPANADAPYMIIKSIAALGRAGLFLEASPGARAVLIVRHPCGHISSVLRGLARNKFDSDIPVTEDFGIYEDLSNTAEAKHYGISLDDFKQMQPVERLAWRWTISNEKCMNDLADRSDSVTIRYEDLCEDPIGVSKNLFQFAELNWNDQTERFVTASTSHQGSESFYQIFRDPKKSAYKWKEELAGTDISQISSIVAQTKSGQLFAKELSCST